MVKNSFYIKRICWWYCSNSINNMVLKCYYVIQDYQNPDVDIGKIIGICYSRDQAEQLFREFYETGDKKGYVFITLDELTVDSAGRVMKQTNLKCAYVKITNLYDSFATASDIRT